MAATTDPLAPLLVRGAIADAVERARQAVDALLANPALARRPAELAGTLSLQAARASAALDDPTGFAGEAGEAAEAGELGELADPTLQGALRVQGELTGRPGAGGLAATWGRAPRQGLARLHLLAAAGLVADPDQLGRPAPAAVPRLDTLTAVLAVTTAPALVVAAVVHAELLAAAAFTPATGVVARGAARLTLIDRGLDPLGLVAIEIGHHALGVAYPQALAAYRSGAADGVDQWLAHCADAVEIAVRAALAFGDAGAG